MAWGNLVDQTDRACIQHLGGAPFLYKPHGAPAVTVQGIFDDQYTAVQANTDYGFGQVGPAVFFRMADLPVDPEIDEPLITHPDGRQYKLKSVQRDGEGGVVLMLDKVGA